MTFPKKKGFTLLELLVVAAIIGLVASVIIVMLNNAKMKARDAKRYAEVDALKKALELHYHNNDKYPEVADWIKIEKDADENGPFSMAMQPYLSQIPRDPLYSKIKGEKIFSYQYKSTTNAQGYKIHVEMETGTYFETSYEVYVGEGIDLTYTPTPAPMVSSVTPNSGSTAGGTAVTITGTNFVDGAAVTFGGTGATGVTVDSPTTIYATTPAHAEGTVDVKVTNPDTQSGTLTDGYTYVDWWNASWPNRVKLTFNNSASVENLYDFPILVSLTSTEVDYTKTKDAGEDIRFVDTDNTTQLKYEIEEWNETGTSVVWVKAPQIDAGSTTDYIWMYYNNTSAVYEQTLADEQAVWSNGFKMVQHLQEISGTHEDSTDQNNDGTAGGGVIQNAAGKINGANEFVPIDDRVEVVDAGLSALLGTLEIVAKSDVFTDYQYFFGHCSPADAFTNRIQLYTNDVAGNLDLGLGDQHQRHLNIQDLDTNIWYYIVLTWNGTNYEVFIDAISRATGSYTGLSSIANADIGNDGNTGSRNEAFDGIIDEVRVSNTARSLYWIQAQYKSMNNTFVNFGSEESY